MLETLLLHILHMFNFKKLALIATKIYSKMLLVTAEQQGNPKQYLPPFFKNGWEVKFRDIFGKQMLEQATLTLGSGLDSVFF